MARWSDLAEWRGPSVNTGDGDSNLNEPEDRMYEYNGQITHIAAGYYEGTISWQRNADANVSSHFVIGRERGKCAQMVDTDIRAWTQGTGNGRWISVENEGFPLGHKLWKPGWHELTDWQIEMNAQIFGRGHQVYGFPLQLTNHPSRDGLGYHGMGAENGFNWGHLHCPGEPIKAQQPLILARAIEIVGGDMSFTKEEKDLLFHLLQNASDAAWKGGTSMGRRIVDPPAGTYGNATSQKADAMWTLLEQIHAIVKTGNLTPEQLAALEAAAERGAQAGVDEQEIVAGVLATLTPEAIADALDEDVAQELLDRLTAKLAS